MYFLSCQESSVYWKAGWSHLQNNSVPILHPFALMFKWYNQKDARSPILLLVHSCHHPATPSTWTILPKPTHKAIYASFKFLPLLSQLRMAKWWGQPGAIYTIIGMEISQSVGKYQSMGKLDRSRQWSSLFFQQHCLPSALLAAPSHSRSLPQQMFTVF